MQEENSRTEQFVREHSDTIRERLLSRIAGKRGEQARVSRETGITTGHLSDLLNGRVPLRLRYVQLIVNALGASLTWTLTGDGHPDDVDTPPAPGVSTPHVQAGALSPDQVGAILGGYDRARYDPEEARLLALFRALNDPVERAQLLADLETRHLRRQLAEGKALTLNERPKGGEGGC